MIMSLTLTDFYKFYSEVLKENPDWLSGANWYDRDDYARILRSMNYSDQIAYELADFIRLQTAHAFNRGVWNALKYATKDSEKLLTNN
jgi:hypothetical protein